MSLHDKNITIRMYNVGFGDSFLLLFPSSDGRRRRILIDCGCHKASVNPPPMKEVVGRIIEDVTDPDGVPRIDVIVATHRHMDHVQGFENKAWAKVEVGEVWMPWTEDPTDKQAKQIREAQSKSATLTLAAARRERQLSLTAAQREQIEKAMVIASNNLVNKKAMETLHTGFLKSKSFAPRRYMPAREGGEIFETEALPGVKVHVLGPSRSLNVIAAHDDEDELYQLLRGPNDAQSDALLPFHSKWMITSRQFSKGYRHLTLSQEVKDRIMRAYTADPFSAATRLEYSVNNTSLMLIFEIGKNFLLFSGDAQWSTWNMVLNSDWLDLLQKTTFYKIGHHGSHNATPIKFVEEVLRPDNFWALASTGPTADWKDIIPRKTLLNKLREKSDRVVRSDRQDVADPQLANFKRAAQNAYVEVEL